MLSARKIGTWLILLLFVGGLFASPLSAAIRADCPMRQATETHCAATPEPVAQTPTCCHPQSETRLRIQSLATGCCCTITAAPEVAETPALLSPVSEPVALPLSVFVASTPPVVAAPVVACRAGNETAPRAPPLRGSPTRAPPVS